MILTAMLFVSCAPAVVAVWAGWALFGPSGRIAPADDDGDFEYGDLGC